MNRFFTLPAICLGLILIGAKVALLLRTFEGAPDVQKMIATTAEDVIVVAVFAAAAWVSMRGLSRRFPRLARGVFWSFVVVGSVGALYAVLNVTVCRAMGYPLNARVFGVIGRFKDLRSSIAEYCTFWTIAPLIAAPVFYAVAAPLLSRVRVGPRLRVALLVVAAAWVGWGMHVREEFRQQDWMRRIGKNPHREFLGSFLAQAVFGNRANIAGPFPGTDAEDFKLARASRTPALPQFARPPRNVILIVLESVSAQYLSLYGSRYPTTPRLEAESRHAMIFDRIYANVGYTYWARFPLFCSVYPGLPWKYWWKGMDANPPRGLAWSLRQRGYRTAFFSVGNPEWDAASLTAECAGFEEVYGPEAMGGPSASSWGTQDGVAVDAMLQWIDLNRGRPFFATAWTDQTHHPYTLAPETVPIDFLRGARVPHPEMLNRYLNAIGQVDHHLGRLMDGLRARGLADDTLVVITADHGEGFDEFHEAMGHGSNLYDETIRVPLMLWCPRLFDQGQRVKRTGAQVDLLPTIAHLIGIEPLEPWQGASLFSEDHPNRAYLYANVSEMIFGVVDGNYKYTYHVNDALERLFDLAADPGEKDDLSRARPDLCAALRARVSAHIHCEEQYMANFRPTKLDGALPVARALPPRTVAQKHAD